MGPTQMSSINSKMTVIEKLAADGANWLSWKSWMVSILESSALLKHIDGTARHPSSPLTFPPGHKPTADELDVAE